MYSVPHRSRTTGACSRMKATDWTARISDRGVSGWTMSYGHDLDVREPLVRGPLHQLELAHPDLALRIAGIQRPIGRIVDFRNTCGFQ